MSDNEEVMMEVGLEQYDTLMDAMSQMQAEGWMDAIRRDEETVQVRPVDRQDDRTEGSRIESDSWLIREDNGDTHTVSNETFEEKFETSTRKEQFLVDLSWDNTVDDDVEVEGWDVIARVNAYINIPDQTVQSLEVVEVSVNEMQMGGIPIEVLKDSPIFDTENND